MGAQQDVAATGEKQKKKGGLLEVGNVIIQALVLALVIRTLLFQPFSIPSGSMLPSLLIGDYLIANKMAYGYSKYSIPFSPDWFSGRIWAGEPKRGDVAVFRPPHALQDDYIKRVIGLPGDKIQIKDGLLHINDVPVERTLVGQVNDIDVTETVGPVDVYRETLPNGVSYETLDLTKNGLYDNSRVYNVPEGHYFMMGDNRDGSSDSRYWGPVPLENFVAKANFIFFSLSGNARPLEIWRWPSELRSERLLKSIK